MRTNYVTLLIVCCHLLALPVLAQTGPWARYDAKMKNDALVRDASAGYLEEVKSIVAGGGDVNVQLEQTLLTPLMAAAASGQIEMVKYLLAQGANPDAKDWNGLTALDRARWTGIKELIALLEEKTTGAKPKQPTPAAPAKPEPKPAPVQTAPQPTNPVILNTASVGSTTWPTFGSLRTGDTVIYHVPTGWRSGIIKEIGAAETRQTYSSWNEKKYLVDPDAYALSDEWTPWSLVVKKQREPFWTAWFIGTWEVGEGMAHTIKVEGSTQTDTYTHAAAGEVVKINKNGTYSWKQLDGKIVSGKWIPATDGPGVVLLKAYRQFDWTVRNSSTIEDHKIRKLETIRLHPSKNVGSTTGKRKAG